MTRAIKFAVSGDEGSFSEAAGLRYANTRGMNPVFEYLIDMEGVLCAVESGEVEIGIFPVVNLQGGLVRMAFDAMGKHQFKVIDELWLEVQQCLLAKPGILMPQIKAIVSHAQAFAQCRLYLQKNFPQVELVEWQDTAKAARDLSQNELHVTSAVIAPKQAASLYGLEVVDENIQDANPNLTAFVIIKQYCSIGQR